MDKSIFIRADELAVELDVSKALAYKMINQWNEELKANHGICLLVVHHTRKMEAGDSFDMISGTNGLLGAADGAFIMQKKRRTDNISIFVSINCTLRLWTQ